METYPTIQIQTIAMSKTYSIVIEYHTVITTNSQVQAMATLIGLYDLFNIEYLAKLRTTLEVLNDLSFKNDYFHCH